MLEEAFYIKGQVMSILGFTDLMVSVATIQLCHYSVEAALYNVKQVGVPL